MITNIVIPLCALLILFICATCYALFKKNNTIADVAWGLGFVLLAWTSLLGAQEYATRQLLVTFLITVWGLRLAYHLGLRVFGTKEDPRYAKWRAEWGNNAVIGSIFQVFVLQMILLIIISCPILYINTHFNPSIKILDLLATITWCIGFIFEAVGDYQLKLFIKNPNNKGRVMRYGLWNFTRHPNYFGEIVMWWAIWIIACSVPGGWITIISPLTITSLLLFVSGIPMNEAQFKDNPEFQEYKQQTSILIPWFRKRSR